MADSSTSTSVFDSVRSPTFAALGQSGFRRFFIGQGISLVGSWLQAAAVRWLVFEQTHSERMLGVVEMAAILPGIFVGLYAGALADRVPPLRMILLMECAEMALAFALTALVGFDVIEIWHMAAILALGRICVTFEVPSRQVLFFELVGREILPNAIALNSGLFNATRVLGPALAGICLTLLGATGCFALNGASFLAAIVAVLTIRLPSAIALIIMSHTASSRLSAACATCGRTCGSVSSSPWWPISACSAWVMKRWSRHTPGLLCTPACAATACFWPVAASEQPPAPSSSPHSAASAAKSGSPSPAWRSLGSPWPEPQSFLRGSPAMHRTSSAFRAALYVCWVPALEPCSFIPRRCR